ncbi:MAG: hypothetical protein K2X91_19275, partial [Thermoleophilia bacterium]|nr:hypothetical protein [Thermoleophilia bacterium]
MRTLKAAALLLGVAALAARSDAAAPMDDFTGYTRPGWPPPVGKGKAAVPAKSVRPFGATIHYTVLDRQGEGVVSRDGDTWGTGIDGFDHMFRRGTKSDKTRLDTSARYLYLYQVVNDSKREAAVRSVSIRLRVPAKDITSWGHWAEGEPRVGAAPGAPVVRGVGFAAPPVGKAGAVAAAVRPVSTDNPAVDPAERHRSPAPAIPAERPYLFRRIYIGDNVPVAAAAADEDAKNIGYAPTSVMLLPAARRSNDLSATNAVRIPFVDPNDVDSLDLLRERERDREKLRGTRDRDTFFRARWVPETIKANHRSTLFGFTSNLPPVIEDAIMTGQPLAVGVAGAAAEAEIVGEAI